MRVDSIVPLFGNQWYFYAIIFIFRKKNSFVDGVLILKNEQTIFRLKVTLLYKNGVNSVVKAWLSNVEGHGSNHI